MTPRLASAFAAVALTVGILVGAAGAVLIHDATSPAMDMEDIAAMHSMMGRMDGSMMDGSVGPGWSMDPAQHGVHHQGSDR